MVNVSGNRHIADGNSVIGQSHGVALDSGKVCKQNRPLGLAISCTSVWMPSGIPWLNHEYFQRSFPSFPPAVVNGDILTEAH